MTIQIRRASQRGHANHGWLDTHHTFSFANFYDPAHMGYGPLRVINEDRVAPGRGFGTHSHRDMEIISYVLEGGLAHRDSLGHGEVLRAGEVQAMSAGSGVRHSEFNASQSEPSHFLQIWIEPAERGTEPRYQQQPFPLHERQGKLKLLVSGDGREGSLQIGQDADLWGTLLSEGQSVTFRPRQGRRLWVQVARGELTANGEPLSAGDGAAIEEVDRLVLQGASAAAELLLFDLP